MRYEAILNKLIGADKDQQDLELRTWLALSGASTAAAIAVLPYALELVGATLRSSGKKKPPMSVAVAASGTQSAIMFGIVTAIGLRAARSQGLGAPHLQNILSGKPADLAARDAALYAAAGAGAALALGL